MPHRATSDPISPQCDYLPEVAASQIIKAVPARALSPDDVRAWSALQQADPASDSPFFRPEFTLAVAGVRQDAEVGVVRVAGEPVCFFPFQRGSGNVARPLAAPTADFHGPIIRPGLQIDAAQLVRGCRLAAWHFNDLLPDRPDFAPYVWSREPSSFIDVSMSFSDYSSQRREAGSQTLRKTMQKHRKLVREVGDVRFELATRDPNVLQQLLLWKAQQCRQRGQVELVSFPWVRQLLEQLLHFDEPDFSAHLAAMYTANKLQAAFFCLRSRHVLHVWIIAHHAELARYSPGYQLLTKLIEQAGELGIRRIDLGRGDERFKTNFANGASLVAEGSVDLRPIQRHFSRAWYRVRRGSASTLVRQRFQLPWNFAKRLRDRFLYR